MVFSVNLCVLFCLFVYLLTASGFKQKDEVTFPDTDGLIAAFGDFDSDKLTDVFIITKGGESFSIEKQYNPREHQLFARTITCKASRNEIILNIIPSDFDGDANMDVVLVLGPKGKPSSSSNYNLAFLKGYGNRLDNCNNFEHFAVNVKSQPFVVDLNGDMISDLLAEDADGKYVVWLGTSKKNAVGENVFEKHSFPLNQKHNASIQSMRKNNSNAFVDLNGDTNTDISIEGEESIMYWHMKDSEFLTYKNISYPKGYDVTGASSFADINGDAVIDHLMPVCKQKKCGIVALRKNLQNLEESSWETIVEQISIDGKNYVFHNVATSSKNSILLPIAARVGDIDGDGFPDLVTVMKQESEVHFSVVILKNVEGNNFFKRTFTPIIAVNDSMLIDVQIASFFDLFEDGKYDIIYSGLDLNQSTIQNKRIKVGIKLNERENDANFLKVLVTSGRCFLEGCYKKNVWQENYNVPYGTNIAGPTVCYYLIDARGYPMKSCAGQLSQSANFALQLPYSLFGLGPDSNYVENVTLRIPEEANARVLEQIVPDSQIVVIPHPINEPSRWVVQFFVTPSEIIYKTLYTFLGICGGLIIIILFLHRKEQLKDLAELEQYRITWPDRRR